MRDPISKATSRQDAATIGSGRDQHGGSRERQDALPEHRCDRVHRVKSWPHLFEATLTGVKTHEMRRRTDRDYRVGDVLLLQEWDPGSETYSGRELVMAITYVTNAEYPCALSGAGLHEDFCILSVKAIL